MGSGKGVVPPVKVDLKSEKVSNQPEKNVKQKCFVSLSEVAIPTKQLQKLKQKTDVKDQNKEQEEQDDDDEEEDEEGSDEEEEEESDDDDESGDEEEVEPPQQQVKMPNKTPNKRKVMHVTTPGAAPKSSKAAVETASAKKRGRPTKADMVIREKERAAAIARGEPDP